MALKPHTNMAMLYSDASILRNSTFRETVQTSGFGEYFHLET